MMTDKIFNWDIDHDSDGEPMYIAKSGCETRVYRVELIADGCGEWELSLTYPGKIGRDGKVVFAGTVKHCKAEAAILDARIVNGVRPADLLDIWAEANRRYLLAGAH